ncbi:MAG TPA: Obg family GTPase CgtA, partial [Anaerolineaceae bacterium]|nr:Obg family GTPase CgtA [Anaerolineaceae bacterium]
LSRSPQVVVLNKMDLPDVQEKFEPIAKSLQEQGIDLMPVSAATGLNMKELMWKAYQVLQETPLEETQEELPVYRADVDPRAFEIEQIEEDTWLVTGKMVEKAAAMTYFDQVGSVRRFQRLMERLGVEKALRNDGIQEGDTVVVGEWELEWWD